MKESANILIEKAERNLYAANRNLSLEDPKLTEDICFNSQQAVEKYLKAFIAYNNQEYPRNHFLGELLNKCKEIDPGFAELEKFNLSSLNDYAVELRYSEMPPPSMEDAKEAISIADQVRSFILNKLKDVSLL